MSDRQSIPKSPHKALSHAARYDDGIKADVKVFRSFPAIIGGRAGSSPQKDAKHTGLYRNAEKENSRSYHFCSLSAWKRGSERKKRLKEHEGCGLTDAFCKKSRAA